MTQAERAMKASLSARGYAVVACLQPYAVGEVIPSINAGDQDEFRHPWGVISETDRADYEAQCDLGQAPRYLNPAYRFFFRVSTD